MIAARTALAVALGLGATDAAAQTCSVGATGVAFGNYSGSASVPTDATGTVSVSCVTVVPVSVSYTIQLSAGLGGTISNRKMTSGANTLSYQLYLDAAHGSIWGDGTSGSGTASDSYGLPLLGSATRNHTVYGRIPIGQRIAPGLFNDLVTVLVNY